MEPTTIRIGNWKQSENIHQRRDIENWSESSVVEADSPTSTMAESKSRIADSVVGGDDSETRFVG